MTGVQTCALPIFRGWWDSYLTEDSKESIKNAVKKNDEGLPIFYESIGRGILDGVNTLRNGGRV